MERHWKQGQNVREHGGDRTDSEGTKGPREGASLLSKKGGREIAIRGDRGRMRDEIEAACSSCQLNGLGEPGLDKRPKAKVYLDKRFEGEYMKAAHFGER